MKVCKLVFSEKEKPQLNTSVRRLVEFLLREGDIDDTKGSVDPFEAMQQGSRIHKKIQSSMGPFYRPEVPMKYRIEGDEYCIGIEGRADGVVLEIDENQNVQYAAIDEIKGMYFDVMSFERPVLVHEAQAKCYAFMLLQDYEIPQIDVILTYCNIETEEIRRFNTTYSREEIEEWFLQIISIFKKWTDFQFFHRKERNASIQGLPFPYDYREGQKKLITDVYRSILREKILFMQAPTGTGKTVSNIYPAVMALGQNLAERIFYLTPKTATAFAARDTFELLLKQGYEGLTILLTAKDKMCMCEEKECNPRNCPFARGHFDRVNDVIFEVITKEVLITREVILNYASEYVVCPFELALDISTWCDHIICDYNYVFDPNVYLKRFFAESKNGDNIFLIDEAHNMVDRARDMYSEVLVKEEFLSIKRYAKPVSKKLVNALEKCNKLLLEYKRQCYSDVTVLEDIDLFIFACENLQSNFDRLFKKEVKFGIYQDEVLEFYFRLRNFLSLVYQYDYEHYRIYCDFDENKNFQLHLFCIDPSAQLQQRLDWARSTIYFSATLLPINYYKDLLCSKKDVYAIYVDSVFDCKKRLLLLGTDVTSKYSRRGDEEYDKFTSYIDDIVKAKKGNYMVFGPSYLFIEDIMQRYLDRNPEADIILQERNMSEADREGFLEEFENSREKSLVAFCTLGGIFSEGIDLVGGKLIGCIILGAGLPQVGNERSLMSDFFDDMDKNGFEYAYLYPGMNKVIQAAGRLIRTQDDVGVIALLDERFRFSSYKKTFPREWSDAKTTSIDSLSLKLTKFWEELG